jgi:type III secretion protein J
MSFRFSRALLASLSLLALCACEIQLQHNLPEQDANDIYVLLTENGISATKVREEGGNEPTFGIKVAKQDATQAAKLLKENSLPRQMQSGFAGIRQGKGMIPTQTEETAMFLEALGGEVSNALNRVDGVLEAKVIVMLPERDDLSTPDQKPHPSASVFLKYRQSVTGEKPLDEASVKSFVSKAVGRDLRVEDVSVIMKPARPHISETDPDNNLVDVMSFQMTKRSQRRFKMMAVLVGGGVLAIVGLSVWSFVRGSRNGRKRRPEPDEEEV